jgi:cytochrome c oxidase subunit 2
VVRDPADKVGTYRGQCAELCGRDHGFMPIVVKAKSKEDYAAWVAQQKAGSRRRAGAAAAAAPAAACGDHPPAANAGDGRPQGEFLRE